MSAIDDHSSGIFCFQNEPVFQTRTSVTCCCPVRFPQGKVGCVEVWDRHRS